MMLSILIPTMDERARIFEPLKRKLESLILPYNIGEKKIELIINKDAGEKKGGKPTGKKRNELIDSAKGKFSVFVDDDDDVPNHYVQSIMSAINSGANVDCIGFMGIITWNGRKEYFRHSVGLPYSPKAINGTYLRPPNHLNPMLTEYFKKIRFPDITFAEDFDFCNRLAQAKLIKNEVFLNIVMYFYKYQQRK